MSPLPLEATADSGPTPEAGRATRAPATGVEQERRKAWGKEWGAIQSAIGKQIRESEK